MLMRTGLGGQYRSISRDGGQTWSEPARHHLSARPPPSPSAAFRPAAISWPSGIIIPGQQSGNPLTAAISSDEGETWTHLRNIEETPDDAWAYPAVTWIGTDAYTTYFNYKGGISLQFKILPAAWFYGGGP